MRKCLEDDFDSIHILDLGGNTRKNPKLSGTTHNVFGIQVGVSINLFVKTKSELPKKAKIYYARTDDSWRKEQKYDFLNEKRYVANVQWKEIIPDKDHTWLTEGLRSDFETFMPMATPKVKAGGPKSFSIFNTVSPGVNTARDALVYHFDRQSLEKSAQQFGDYYNSEVYRYIQKDKPQDIDSFVNYDHIKWSRNLKRHLKNADTFSFDTQRIRASLYRPFTKLNLYYGDIIVDEPGIHERLFPFHSADENQVICVNLSGEKPFCCLMSNVIPNFVMCGGFGAATACFPLFTYSEHGTSRHDNITDWALTQFEERYTDNHISKLDIFNYVYAVLHHPQYRQDYAANLKRKLPRIPLASDFWTFAKAGKELANLHVNYEAQPEYKLTWIEDIDARVNYRIERMTLSKDKTQIIYNDFVTLGGIQPEVFEYRLGNRSALDWIIDQYQVSTDKRSGITNDPNRLDDPQYIIRLIGKIVTVSVETVKIVKSLPELS